MGSVRETSGKFTNLSGTSVCSSENGKVEKFLRLLGCLDYIILKRLPVALGTG